MGKNRELRDAGYLYDGTSGEPELTEDRNRAKDLCFEFNCLTRPSDTKRQQGLLDKILGKHGKNTGITAPFYVDYGYQIEVGDNFYANHNLVVLDPAKVRIGNNVFIACNVTLTTAGHPTDAETRNKGIEYAYPITIGDDVWIGANVCVLPGVTIGSNVVIGAGSVVNKDIPSGVVAAGNPCRPIREITEADKYKYLVPPKCCEQQKQ